MEREIRKSSVYLTCPAKPGPNLTFLGKNMAEFTYDFNQKTKDKVDECTKLEKIINSNNNVETYPKIYLYYEKAA